MAKTFKILFILALLGALAAAGITYTVYQKVKDSIPTKEEMKAIELQIPLRIYTRDEKLIGEFGDQRRTPIRYEDIPRDLENAVLAAEDSNFYHHPGVDVIGLLRAAFQLVSTGEIQSGGSTITMQVSRNYFLSFEQTFMRKFTEIFISLKLEDELTKESDVVEAAVIGVPSERWGETPVGFVMLGDGARDCDSIREAVNSRLGKTQRLAQLHAIEEMPRSHIGKLLKTDLREEAERRGLPD